MDWDAAQFALIWLLGWQWLGRQAKDAGKPFNAGEMLASLFFWPIACVAAVFLKMFRKK